MADDWQQLRWPPRSSAAVVDQHLAQSRAPAFQIVDLCLDEGQPLALRRWELP